ncbi:MAG: DUF2946 family protein [Acetobacteraceae bacterium]
MRRTGLFQHVRSSAALAVVLGVLLQALLGMPLTLRMMPDGLDGVAFCGAAHPAGAPGDPAQRPAGHDHAHCLLCQAGPVPPPTTFVLQTPQGETAAAAFADLSRPGIVQRLRPAFASRAPPLTA